MENREHLKETLSNNGFLEDNWEAVHVYFSKEETEYNFIEFMVVKYKF